MKKIIIAAALLMIFSGLKAQHNRNRANTYSDEEPGNDGFKVENLFIGGSLNLGYSGLDFNVGGSPEVGYSLKKWLDVGFLVNLDYSSEMADPNYYYNPDTRQRSFTYGVGTFARLYPVRFLFFQVEPEYNWTHLSATDMATDVSATANLQAASLLLGIGYSQRIRGRSNFYIALMFDALSNYGSPYRDANNIAIPVIKAGFDIYLHPHRN
jgi:hypothetical protein